MGVRRNLTHAMVEAEDRAAAAADDLSANAAPAKDDPAPAEKEGRPAGNNLVARFTEFLERNVQEVVGEAVIKMAEGRDRTMLAYLETPSKETAGGLVKTLTATVTSVILSRVGSEAAGAAGGMLGSVGYQAFLKMGGGAVVDKLAKVLSHYVVEKLNPGGIPDDLSSKSGVLKAFDLPDNVSANLSPQQRANLVAIMGMLRNRPELFKTQWAVLNSVQAVRPTGQAATRATAVQNVHRTNDRQRAY